MATEQEYYDGDEHGKYAYVTLEQVVNDYMASKNPDDYDANTPRHLVLNHARWGIRELYMDVAREVRAIELDLSTTLTVTLPPDYVDHVRISWVGEDGSLYPMTENKSLSISRQYLQDSNYGLMFDQDGNILQGTPITQVHLGNTGDGIKDYNFCSPRFQANVDRSKQFENGSYRIDTEAGLIRFDSTAVSKAIVLEYISDGLFFDTNKGQTQADVRIHKYAEQALHDYIFWKLTRKRRNVPRYAQLEARREYYNSKRRTKRRLNQSTHQELMQVLRGGSVWIKRPS